VTQPVTPELAKAIQAGIQAGRSNKELAAQLGVSFTNIVRQRHLTVQDSVAKIRARLDASVRVLGEDEKRAYERELLARSPTGVRPPPGNIPKASKKQRILTHRAEAAVRRQHYQEEDQVDERIAQDESDPLLERDEATAEPDAEPQTRSASAPASSAAEAEQLRGEIDELEAQVRSRKKRLQQLVGELERELAQIRRVLGGDEKRAPASRVDGRVFPLPTAPARSVTLEHREKGKTIPGSLSNEILALARRTKRPITAGDLVSELAVDRTKGSIRLAMLATNGILKRVSKGEYVPAKGAA
jgi:hypothetical protein